MTEYAQSQGISVQNTCYHCALVSEYSPELRCLTCNEDKESRDDFIAYELVDEGNLQYGDTVPLRVDEPSGSDWIASETYIKPQTWTARFTEKWDDDTHLIELSVKFEQPDEDYLTRHEFSPPIVQLVDGGTLDNLWEMEDYTQQQRETKCQWCNLMTPKQFNDCQVCDKPLENNLV